MTTASDVPSIGLRVFEMLLSRLRPDLSALERLMVFAALDSQEPVDRVRARGGGRASMGDLGPRGLMAPPQLCADEFMNLHRFLEIRVRSWHRHATRWGQRWRDPLRGVVLSRAFRYTFDGLVAANTVVILLQFLWTRAAESAALEVVQLVFLSVFAFEIALCLLGVGLRDYWRDGFNRLDMVAVLAAAIAVPIARALGAEDGDGDDSSGKHEGGRGLSQLIILFRVVRLFRVLRLLRPFRLFFRTTLDIVPSIMRYLALLSCHYYFFAIIGMEALAGRISRDDPAVVASSYGQSQYWNNNFDSLGRSFVTLFEL